MSDVTLMRELVELKNLVDANDDAWKHEEVAAERNVLQILFSRTERLARAMSDARCEDAAIVVAVAVAVVRARLAAAVVNGLA